MAQFSVHGPFRIPFISNGNHKHISKPDMEFWTDDTGTQPFQRKKGCYVFGIKNKNIRPCYIGVTTKSFKEEIFTADKINKYNDSLFDMRKGLPVLFFVTPTNNRVINQEFFALENFLIQLGLTVNEDIKNIRGRKAPTWGIRHIIRSEVRGNLNGDEKLFRQMFRLTR